MTDINVNLGPTTTEEVRRVWLADDGRQTTHWEGCWRVHPACCIGMLVRQVEEDIGMLVRQVEEDAAAGEQMRERIEWLMDKAYPPGEQER